VKTDPTGTKSVMRLGDGKNTVWGQLCLRHEGGMSGGGGGGQNQRGRRHAKECGSFDTKPLLSTPQGKMGKGWEKGENRQSSTPTRSIKKGDTREQTGLGS